MGWDSPEVSCDTSEVRSGTNIRVLFCRNNRVKDSGCYVDLLLFLPSLLTSDWLTDLSSFKRDDRFLGKQLTSSTALKMEQSLKSGSSFYSNVGYKKGYIQMDLVTLEIFAKQDLLQSGIRKDEPVQFLHTSFSVLLFSHPLPLMFPCF